MATESRKRVAEAEERVTKRRKTTVKRYRVSNMGRVQMDGRKITPKVSKGEEYPRITIKGFPSRQTWSGTGRFSSPSRKSGTYSNVYPPVLFRRPLRQAVMFDWSKPRTRAASRILTNSSS